jgi:WD40 repeat protein
MYVGDWAGVKGAVLGAGEEDENRMRTKRKETLEALKTIRHLIPKQGGGGRLGCGVAGVLGGGGSIYLSVNEDTEQKSLSFISVETGEVLRRIAVGPGNILALALSQNGAMWAAATEDTLQIWSPGASEPITHGIGGLVWMSFQDGALLASSHQDAYRIDPASGEILSTARIDSPIEGIAAGSYVLVIQFRSIGIYSTAMDGNKLKEINVGFQIAHLGSDASSPLVVVTGKETAEAALVDVHEGRVVRRYDLSALPPDPSTPETRTFPVNAAGAALTPDGKRVLVSSGLIWSLEAETGKPVLALDPVRGEALYGIGWRPIGFSSERTAVLGREWLFRLDLDEGREITEGEVFPLHTWALAWGSDNRTLVSAHSNVVNLWDVKTGEHRCIDIRPGTVTDAAVAPDVRTVWLSHDRRGLLLADTKSGQILETLPVLGSRLALCAKGSLLAALLQDSVVVLDPTSGSVLKELSTPGARAIGFDPTGEILVAGSPKKLFIWSSREPKKLKTLKGPGYGIDAMKVTEERILILSGESASVTSYGIDGKRQTLLRSKTWPTGVFSNRGDRILWKPIGPDVLCRLDGAPLARLEPGPCVMTACFSPDDRLIAASLGDHSLVVLELPEQSL